MFAEVAVNSSLPHAQTFSYAVPSGMSVDVGHAVYVPFGSRTLQGIVVELSETSSWPETREILAHIEERPLLRPDQVKLAEWISKYYVSSLYGALALMLPPAFGRKPVTIIESRLTPRQVLTFNLTPTERRIADTIVVEGEMEITALQKAVTAPDFGRAMDRLTRVGLISRRYELAKPRVRPKVIQTVRLIGGPQEVDRFLSELKGDRRSRPADVLDALAVEGDIPLPEARRVAGAWGPLNRLVADGYARIDTQAGRFLSTQDAAALREHASVLRQSRSHLALREAIAALATDGVVTVAQLRRHAGLSAEGLKRLQDEGLVTIREDIIERNPLSGREFAPAPVPRLSDDQAAAVNGIAAAFRKQSGATFLLQGVTGSGKTEVYLELLRRALDLGKRAIVLVPEISLTPQTVERFARRFPDGVAVLHSRLTLGERFDQWGRIRDGKHSVVIGARSALFVPQPDLGLIILDEEHEWTYKQQDPAPRYHARTVAQELATLTGAVVVLGTATPDVVTYYRALTGEYELRRLPDRVAGGDRASEVGSRATQALPRVEVVDMREELKAGNRSVFSRSLAAAISETLSAGEQTILFLNRRGTASFFLCRDCSYVPRCSSCDVALTYHEDDDRLVCHMCNRRRRVPSACPGCGEKRLRPVGIGTQGLEEEVLRTFPTARTIRWDRDATRDRDSHERLLRAFQEHSADILIGTQMVAKGLDLPLVTLVGVVSADISLNLPDYRSSERTFQLLTQVAGRAGRADRPGRVIIQTYEPEHPAVECAAGYKTSEFYAGELASRRRLGYPPFGSLVRLMFAHTNGAFAAREAQRVRATLEALKVERDLTAIDVIGPSPGYVRRVRGRFRWQIVLRGEEPRRLVEGLHLGQGWIVDVDPASLL